MLSSYFTNLTENDSSKTLDNKFLNDNIQKIMSLILLIVFIFLFITLTILREFSTILFKNPFDIFLMILFSFSQYIYIFFVAFISFSIIILGNYIDSKSYNFKIKKFGNSIFFPGYTFTAFIVSFLYIYYYSSVFFDTIILLFEIIFILSLIFLYRILYKNRKSEIKNQIQYLQNFLRISLTVFIFFMIVSLYYTFNYYDSIILSDFNSIHTNAIIMILFFFSLNLYLITLLFKKTIDFQNLVQLYVDFIQDRHKVNKKLVVIFIFFSYVPLGVYFLFQFGRLFF